MLEPIDKYCERVEPGLLGSPVNVAGALVILAVAIWLLRRPEQPGLSRQMSAVAVMIGMTSVLLHVWPNTLTGVIDVVPKAAFVVLVLFAYLRDLLKLSTGVSATVALFVLPLVGVSLPLILVLEGPMSTAAYGALPVIFLGMGVLLRQRDPVMGRQMLLVTLVFMAAMVMRSADLPLCDRFPIGTHFLWELGAAATLGMLIGLYRRHLLAGQGRGR